MRACYNPFPVFRSWHCLHNGCQFLSSQKSCGLPRCGRMWSTTVAGVNTPRFKQAAHRGLLARKRLRAFRQSAPYPRSAALPRQRSGDSLWCSAQYVPFSHRLGQPGYRHGRFGLLGIAFHLGFFLLPFLGMIHLTEPKIHGDCRPNRRRSDSSWHDPVP